MSSSQISPTDIAQHEEALSSTFARGTYVGVCIVDGLHATIRVERGALEVSDGTGPYRRVRRYGRATHGLTRLVGLNVYSGTISFDALRWCQKLGIGITLLGADGVPVFYSSPRTTDDARLRRVQAMAPDQPVGLGIARYLLSAKVEGQARVLRDRFGELSESDELMSLVNAIKAAPTIDECRQLEAEAASRYWGCWGGPVSTPIFVSRDRSRIPAHWVDYAGRRSSLKSVNGNRGAERPINALLNYIFALLEAEAINACYAVGLDPGLGIVHLDTRGRQSMALDLLEPCRPLCEDMVLTLLATRTFKKSDFVELPDGRCRLKAPLTHEVAEMMPKMGLWLAPYAEKVAHMLGEAMNGKYTPTTPLTQNRTRKAQSVIKARKATPVKVSLYRCPDCGASVMSARHVLCSDCQVRRGHTPTVRANRGRAISARKQALKLAQDTLGFPADKEWYLETVLPKLANHTLSEIEKCGFSKSYASYVRSGRYVPSTTTWRSLYDLTHPTAVASTMIPKEMEKQ